MSPKIKMLIHRYDVIGSRFGQIRRQPFSHSKHVGDNMQNRNLAMMSVDELWRLREEIDSILSTKIEAEKQELEYRLAGAKPILRLISRTG
jgi:hypothetical protein